MTIRAVLWDLGGVLIDWNPRHLYRKLIADEAEREAFLRDICNQEWNVLQDEGRSLAEATRTLSSRFPDQAALIEAYYARWPEMLAGEIPGSVALFASVRALGLPCFALTNWSAETFPVALERYGFLQWFDGRLVSGEERLIKPDPRIFRLAASRFRLVPEETLFIDDNPDNAASALRLGFVSHRFEDAQGLALRMRDLGLAV